MKKYLITAVFCSQIWVAYSAVAAPNSSPPEFQGVRWGMSTKEACSIWSRKYHWHDIQQKVSGAGKYVELHGEISDRPTVMTVSTPTIWSIDLRVSKSDVDLVMPHSTFWKIADSVKNKYGSPQTYFYRKISYGLDGKFVEEMPKSLPRNKDTELILRRETQNSNWSPGIDWFLPIGLKISITSATSDRDVFVSYMYLPALDQDIQDRERETAGQL